VRRMLRMGGSFLTFNFLTSCRVRKEKTLK
jgi:hypothetical protein